jgi:hypothetical protein
MFADEQDDEWNLSYSEPSSAKTNHCPPCTARKTAIIQEFEKENEQDIGEN